MEFQAVRREGFSLTNSGTSPKGRQEKEIEDIIYFYDSRVLRIDISALLMMEFLNACELFV